jgi:hypothetical protein
MTNFQISQSLALFSKKNELTSEVSLFESEIEIEMKRYKIISIIEIEIQLK